MFSLQTSVDEMVLLALLLGGHCPRGRREGPGSAVTALPGPPCRSPRDSPQPVGGRDAELPSQEGAGSNRRLGDGCLHTAAPAAQLIGDHLPGSAGQSVTAQLPLQDFSWCSSFSTELCSTPKTQLWSSDSQKQGHSQHPSFPSFLLNRKRQPPSRPNCCSRRISAPRPGPHPAPSLRVCGSAGWRPGPVPSCRSAPAPPAQFPGQLAASGAAAWLLGCCSLCILAPQRASHPSDRTQCG